MKPFFTFFGGKWRAAPRYPNPVHNIIVEPFAGAAGYSVRHYTKKIILVEKDPLIAALWQYLILATTEQIMALPLIEYGQNVDSINILPEERSLIGFWLNKGNNRPRKTPSAWMRKGTHATSFWGKEIRERIANQVPLIKHWYVINGDYSNAPDIEATWFIDPPYQKAGKEYKFSSKSIDFPKLGDWCKQRDGQVLVCENDGADWLPFKPYLSIKANESNHGGKVSKESLWTN